MTNAYEVALDRAARVIRNWDVEPGVLLVSCYRCTRYAKFIASTRQLAAEEAAMVGWVKRGGKSVCPRCNA